MITSSNTLIGNDPRKGIPSRCSIASRAKHMQFMNGIVECRISVQWELVDIVGKRRARKSAKYPERDREKAFPRVRYCIIKLDGNT
jgi:hypothetical protein